LSGCATRRIGTIGRDGLAGAKACRGARTLTANIHDPYWRVIAVDTNVLVHAHREDSPHHAAAYNCVATLAEGADRWGIPWPCVYEFLAVVTHPRIYAPPTPLLQALDQLDAWLTSPVLVVLGEGPEHWETLNAMLARGHVAGPQVHDGRIAAICHSHAVAELWTADREFGRFPDLRVTNPLVL
jgi:toxin-antitoxin system PIN domain toxin